LHPATAARDFHIIQDRPALKADAMLARFQNAGGKVDWKEYTDDKVTGVFSHPNGGELAVTWTIDQASKIGLVKPGSGWQKFPRAMLRSRCISEGIRSVFPGSVTGFYTPAEVETFTPPKDLGKVDEVTGEVRVDYTSVQVPYKGDISEIVEDIPDAPKIQGRGNIGSHLHKHALYVPGNDEPYAQYFSLEDWIDGFCDLIDRIEKSDKMDRKEKNHKYELLRRANDQFTRTWSGGQTAKFLTAVQKVRSM